MPMKRYGHLWPEIVSLDNLYLAYRKARKGKQNRDSVADFSLRLEAQLLALQNELSNGTYIPGEYRLFTIYEGKPRLIAAAPFRDRVVHHALMNLIEPLLDPHFIDQSYACRKGKGVHKAVDYYQQQAKQYAYALKMDVQAYFPSIDHQILQTKISRYVKDKKVLDLFGCIIAGSPTYPHPPCYFPGDDLFTPLERRHGIPIGNLTSQFLANLYLNDLDHHFRSTLKVPAYLRYVDDIIVLADSKKYLSEIRKITEDYLLSLRLNLHPRKAHIVPVSKGVDVFGYFVYPHCRRLRNENGYRFVRKLRRFSKAYARNDLDWIDFNASVQSWIGHASHADTKALRETLFSAMIFQRESGN
ncbi:reverse transcriptase domain-containing protein [Candidatus Venteria ishoeyi]|uniref:reverse transcriptase domain-containing protein n=1 Tax=Candidatus Venteria ishoeyi TaxID=1899563 RepID=UPI0025A66587|nr:reverse transcriptase domain-containing protein [Candidatus Venteria ishoeyi]MDM8545983.1 reverse transcriptase domain-containing protein [Candidatus Venteria ishoeyi]